MSGPPPNYDPSASMLHGGTNSVIQPVMGGGGAPPPNYNIDSSMLSGGTEPILKVLGGGAKEKKTLGKLQAEVYEVFENDRTIQNRNTYVRKLVNEYATKKGQLQVYLNQYYYERINQIKRYETKGPAQNPGLPTLTAANANTITNIPLTYDVISSQTDTIIMIPPIHGDLEKFIEILQFLFKTEIFRKENSNDLRLKNNVTIICMAPFYEGDDIEYLLLLMYLHMRLWDVNRDSFFVLSDPSDVELGKLLYDPANGVQFPAAPNDILFSSLNPSQIILEKPFGAFKGIVFTSAHGQSLTIPKKDKNAAFVSPSQAAKSHQTFSVSPALVEEEEDTLFKNYLLVGSRGYKDDLIQPRTDVPVCKGLVTIFYDEDFPPNKNQYHIANKKEQIHVFRFDRIQENPLLCIDEDGDIANLIPPPGAFASKENHPRFEKGATKKVVIDAVERRIRNGTNPKVFQNWTEGIFSKDEADLLNSLQLTPALLAFVFDTNWQNETAQFLKKVVISDCFTDVRVITRAECDSVRNFLNKILDYFYAHAAYKMDEPPIKRIVLPKVIVEEPAPILEPPAALPAKPRPTAIGAYVWADEVSDIREEQFDKKQFGKIELQIDGNDYYIDFIVIQKETGANLFKRLRLPIAAVKSEAKRRRIQDVTILTEKMNEIKGNYPDFIFLY